MKRLRIGSGAGYGGDRLEPALTLMQEGQLDYIAFECLAERTIALAQKARLQDPSSGYNPLLEYRMREVLPLIRKHGVGVLTNMGAANPAAASQVVLQMARELNAGPLKVATVLGDDVLDLLEQFKDLPILETGEPLSSLKNRILSANAYLGAAPLVRALEEGADVVMTGRVADPALFLAPMIHRFGWSFSDFDRLGKGTLVGHLLECAGQICGGYFADAGRKAVPEPWNLGFPLAEVAADGSGFVTKVAGTGGRIDTSTCTEQLLYEIHDPARYLTPDCAADFSKVQFEETAQDQVAFSGAGGLAPTDSYKVSVGYRNGFTGEGQMSYSGSDCTERARLAGEIVIRRLERMGIPERDLRVELIGWNATHPVVGEDYPPMKEVRLRVCAHTENRDLATLVGREVETLYTNGPFGGGGAAQRVDEVISVASVLLPKSAVKTEVLIEKG